MKDCFEMTGTAPETLQMVTPVTDRLRFISPLRYPQDKKEATTQFHDKRRKQCLLTLLLRWFPEARDHVV